MTVEIRSVRAICRDLGEGSRAQVPWPGMDLFSTHGPELDGVPFSEIRSYE
ncbi:hypothetical protein [Nonomuraea sp. MG754425]|uniref:hypothetical protein n=1 Tax=Nonomuraea sp. MG754425 TaxID=2570319 RepID=UPI001F475D8A|nr:hypothetical protein [Nonomuraea sp. MG754425]